jgi:hypothetical protein
MPDTKTDTESERPTRRRRYPNRRLVNGMLAHLVALRLLAACAEPDDAEGGSLGDNLAVIARPLTAATTDVIFTVRGDGIGDGTTEGIGIRGSAPSGSPASSTASLVVPEGLKLVFAYGFDSFVPSGSGLDFPSVAYELRDQCNAPAVSLQTGGVRGVEVTCATLDAGTGDVGLERLILMSNYDFDPAGEFAGSLDGSNVSRVVVDGEASNAAVSVTIEQGLGCFDALPEVWPAPPFGNNCGGSTDANGDWVGYLVAEPGASPHSSVHSVQIGPFASATSRFYGFRIGGVGRLDVVAE